MALSDEELREIAKRYYFYEEHTDFLNVLAALREVERRTREAIERTMEEQ